MFYSEDVIKNECLEEVWKTANHITSAVEEENDLTKICDKLESWVRNDSEMAHRRLSLRTSATLVSGAARMYRTAACKLFEDVMILNEDLIYRRKRENTNISSDSEVSSDSEQVPEQMRTHDIHRFDASFSPTKRMRVCESTRRETSPRVSNVRSSNTRCSNNTEIRTSNNSSSDKCCDSLVPIEDCENSPMINRKDQAVQTSITIPQERDSLADDGLDKNLPFGYIIIHDNTHSRVPSRIIVSSLNANVRNLI